MTPRHSILLSLFLFFFTPLIALSADTAIFISEIQITGTHADDEFIRLLNTTNSLIDVTGFRLAKKALSSGICKESALVSEKSFIGSIPPKAKFLISHPAYKETYSADLTYSSASYYITDNTVILLYDKNKNLIDRKDIGKACDDITPPINPSPPPIEPHSYDIRINEIFPNPINEDDEWVELFNFGQDSISLTGWTLTDKTKSYPFTESDGIAPKKFFLLSRTKSNIALNNTNEIVTLLDASKNIVSQVSYEKTIEGASFNYTASGYRWSKTLTPGAENILNNAPETKKTDIPETAFLNVLTSFSASGKDSDGDTMRYTWNFGDGHKSYKKETTHRYEKKGAYEGTLTVTDGTEETITAFTIEVEKYEAPKVRMTSLIPNPSGKDTGTESIEIENRSKKSVDLLGWSIATGWKNLINHPIRESFIIPGKSRRALTHFFSAFTLPNEKGKIELRSPDGKTVQKLKYNLKGKSAKENARLVKEKGGKWEWIIPQLTDDSQQKTNDDNQKQEEISREEKQLKQDTETITFKKDHGERLFSAEKDAPEEMRKFVSYGTYIETPAVVLAPLPQVAGASDETEREENFFEEDAFDLNALINRWLAEE